MIIDWSPPIIKEMKLKRFCFVTLIRRKLNKLGVYSLGFYFYLTIIIGCSLLYYGYVKKIDNELKMKEIELEEKKLELEMKKLDQGNKNSFL
jgi:hypothetical protein